MANQCYYGGDFWAAVTAVTAGQTPETHPEKWQRLTIPHAFADFIGLDAAARLQPGEGQLDKAAGMKALADDALQRAIILDARTNGRGHQPSVWTR